MKVKIKWRKRNEKKLTTWRLNNMLPKTNGSIRKLRRKFNHLSRKIIMKTQSLKIYGMPEKQCSEGNS